MTSRCPHLVFYLSISVTLLASSTCRLLYVRQGKAPLWSMIGLYVHQGIAAQCNTMPFSLKHNLCATMLIFNLDLRSIVTAEDLQRSQALFSFRRPPRCF
ncbi:hypothetical protein IW261DRAFT_334776 [Armillaria novae-zelandiae]|uniref:Secreted protein n=1 Tax=Armillaria novae-zelandiae TaxID=153914 RepID=A0AA39U3N3_9AGAR|nr:hypothetical protein IW261DRAFT_334776 [Armillaria novae-zelandiae]